MGYSQERVCVDCGDTYTAISHNAERCAGCRAERRRSRMRVRHEAQTCEVCGDEFVPYRHGQVTCGKGDCQRSRMNALRTPEKPAGDEQIERLFRYYKERTSITVDNLPEGTRVLVTGDHQIPFIDEDFEDAKQRFIADWKPDVVVLNGDVLDCVTPETSVLTWDLRWVEAGALEVGDELIGFDEYNVGAGVDGRALPRKLRRAVVEKLGRADQQIYALHMSDGTVLRCSPGHRWLGWKSTKNNAAMCWITASEIAERWAKGRPVILNKPLDTWERERDYDSGYIAGAFDGEGHLTFHARANNFAHLAFNQRPNIFLDQVDEALHRKGYRTYRAHSDERTTTALNILGGMWEQASFIGRFDVPRFLSKWIAKAPVDGYQLRSTKRASVVGVEMEGVGEIVRIQTSTKTYIAEGFASHNCYELSEWDKRPGRLFNLEDEIRQAADLIDTYRRLSGGVVYFIDGNHEERLQRTIWKHAQGFSFMVADLPEALELERRTAGFVPYGQHIDLHGFVITHGTVVRQHSAYTAKAMIDKYRSSGASGHTHRIGSHSLTDHRGVSHTWYEIGCSCRKDLEYMKAHPNWQQGFLVGEIRDGALHPSLVRVIEAKGKRGFVAAGQHYRIGK